ncbi:MAG TPA: M13 family metallopeptidase N-terminal domain-containing protein [Acidobacteriaceae bacterium]|nr:M13 family metallopeptidase N-terminal domain-containing protein [Acidobacteriaceae bacterium]
MRPFVILSLLAFTGPLCAAQTLAAPDTAPGPTHVPKKLVSFDLSAIDTTADPCTDFYQYACGNWRKANPIPADQVRWGRFNELADRNLYLLYADLHKAAVRPSSALQTKYGSFFAACMNEDGANRLGAKPLQPQLALIDTLKSPKDLAALNVQLSQRFGDPALLNIGVQQDQKDSTRQILATGQGGLSLPDRDYYLTKDERGETLRQQYVAHVTKMFTLLGDTPAQAAAEAAAVMKIETALAEGSMSRVEMRDPAKRYHVMTVAEVEKLSPSYNWKQFLGGEGLGSVPSLNVSSPHFVETVNGQLESEPLSDIRSYLRWHALHTAAPWLSKPFADENFAFFSATLQGQKEQQPRWKRCTRVTDAALGEAVGQDWVRENFPPAAKDNMEKLVKALEAALSEDINQLPWMSADTKVQAQAKLKAFRQKIGYPDKWRDYSKLTVDRADLLGNIHAAKFLRIGATSPSTASPSTRPSGP